MANQYPFDPHGNNPANLIQNEQIPLTLVNDPQVNMVVPSAAPFFRRDLEVRFRPPGVIGDGTLMVEGVDYWLGWKFVAASRTIGEPVYGCIIFTDPNKQGSALIKKYRTLGGDWVQNPTAILEMLNNVAFHPRITTWDEVTPQLVAFPVVNHPHDISNLRGMEDVVDALGALPPAILAAASTGMSAHLAASNPHNITKYIIGLSNVENYAVATGAQAIAALSDTAYMTPLKTRQLLEAALGSAGLGGLIFGGGSSGPGDGGDVGGPAGGVLTNELALFDGTTGKFIKGTAGATLYFTAADRRGLEIRTNGALRAAMRMVAAGGRVDVLVPSGVSGNVDVTLPSVTGTLITAEQLAIAQGRVPFRNAAGAGAPDSSIVASQSIANDAIVIRKSNGQISVPDVPLVDSDAVSKKHLDTNFVPLTADIFLRVDGLQASSATPSNQRTFHSAAIISLLQNYTTAENVNQVIDDLNMSTVVRTDTDLFIRVANIQAANAVPSATTVYSTTAVTQLIANFTTQTYVNQQIDDLNIETVLRNDTNLFIRIAALQPANAVPSTTTVYHTAAVDSLLENYATEAWVEQQLEDLGIDPNPDPVTDVTLDIITIEVLAESTPIARNTFVIIESVVVDGELTAPSEDLIEGDRFTIAIMENTAAGVTVFADVNAPFYNSDLGTVLRDNFVSYTYQYDTERGWVRTSIDDYYPNGKQLSGANLRANGSIALGATLPVVSDYPPGTVLELSNTTTIGGHVYNAGSMLVRMSTTWLHLGGIETADLEQTIDVLIEGFDNLTAALLL